MNRYFAEPYEFIPPYRSQFWVRLIRPCAPFFRRLALDLRRFEIRGIAHLRESLERRAGILLAPNHWCFADGFVVGNLTASVGAYCHYLVSYHIFRRGRFRRWLIRRLGGFSVLREGSDRETLRAGANILAEGRRPLAVFAEGTWYRQNDRVGPFQQGAAMIAHLAARHAQRPIVVHPVAIKYWLLADPRPALRRRLDALERQLTCSRPKPTGFVDRLEAVTAAWLSMHERAHLGQESKGDTDDRRDRLLNELLARLELQDFGQVYVDSAMDRVRRLRGLYARRITIDADGANANAAAKHLETLLLCECLFSHSVSYLHGKPSWEQVAESVQRLGEIVWDKYERPLTPMGVVVDAGSAVSVPSQAERQHDPQESREALTVRLAERVQGQLDCLIAQGPPAAWKVPAGDWGVPCAA